MSGDVQKVAIKSKGGAHGKQVIDKLISLGASNPCNMTGCTKNSYYFINCVNQIDIEFELPCGYTELFID